MKVLVTTDGSEVSWTVAPHAAVIARATGGELILARVIDPLMDASKVISTDLKAAVDQVADEWKAHLEAEAARRGIEARVVIPRLPRNVDVHDAICKLAADEGAGLIAMHARGTGALRHALLGSVAMGVLGKGEATVMVTGNNARPPAVEDVYRIALTTDGSEAAQEIIPHIAKLAEGSSWFDFVLINVYDRDEAESVALLETARANIPAHREVALLPVKKQSRNAAEDIVRAATGAAADAIAMATHGHGALRHLIAGSVALDVLARSPLPVILARRA